MDQLVTNYHQLWDRYGERVIWAFLFPLIGIFLAKASRPILLNMLKRRKVDDEIAFVICNAVSIVLIVCTVLEGLANVGVHVTALGGLDYLFQILFALVVLVAGVWAAKAARKIVAAALQRRQVEGTIAGFVSTLTYAVVMVFTGSAVLTRLGIETTSFVTIIGAAGLAIGLAFQATLSNFAAGFLLVIFKPFRTGDYIEGGGTGGIVQEIQIFTTRLVTPDNKMIIIPNSKLTSDNITNFSALENRRVDMIFGVSYDDDLRHVKQVLLRIINENSKILKQPEPLVAVQSLADSSVNFAVRVWVRTPDYWPVYFSLNETVKLTFDEEGISIPFPHRVLVHTTPTPTPETTA